MGIERHRYQEEEEGRKMERRAGKELDPEARERWVGAVKGWGKRREKDGNLGVSDTYILPGFVSVSPELLAVRLTCSSRRSQNCCHWVDTRVVIVIVNLFPATNSLPESVRNAKATHSNFNNIAIVQVTPTRVLVSNSTPLLPVH